MTNKDTENLLSGTQLAKELNISAGRVSQLITKLDLSDTLIKNGNRKLLPKDTEQAVRDYFISTKDNTPKIDNHDSLIAINGELNKRIEELIKDKEAYRSDIEEQKKQITMLVQSNYSLNNKLELIETKEQSKKGFWARLFGGK